jgi:hypothetical protein
MENNQSPSNQFPIVEATRDGFIRFADFSGVSTRAQYWYFVLSTTIATVIAQIAFGDFGGNVVSFITLIPQSQLPSEGCMMWARVVGLS